MVKKETISALNKIMANYFVLYIKLYRYQWFVKGEQAYLLLRLFKDLQTEVKKDIDDISTYILASDGKPYATMVKFLKESTIDEATADDEAEEMVSELIHNFSTILSQVEHLIDNSDHGVKHFIYTFQRKLQSTLYLFEQMQK